MFTQLIRIGRDAELRYTTQQKAVCSVVGAFDVGYGDNKRTTWIEGALWEKRAESLAPYLVKGQEAVVTFDDLEVETYEGKNGLGAKLEARIVDLQLCGSKPEVNQQQSQQPPARQQSANTGGQQPAHGFSDFDQDIPFANPYKGIEHLV